MTKGCLDQIMLGQPFIFVSIPYTMPLLRYLFPLWLLAAVSFVNATAQDTPQTRILHYTILPGSKVTVIGSTNVNEFTCVSEQTLYDHEVVLISSATHTEAKFGNATLRVKTESLDCGNVVMNTNLCNTMHAGEFPFIIVNLMEVKSSNGTALNPATASAMVAKTYITLAGKRKINLVKVESMRNTDGSLRFRGHHKISLSDYGLDPPSAFFGLIHVDDIITVQFDLLIMAKEALVQ